MHRGSTDTIAHQKDTAPSAWKGSDGPPGWESPRFSRLSAGAAEVSPRSRPPAACGSSSRRQGLPPCAKHEGPRRRGSRSPAHAPRILNPHGSNSRRCSRRGASSGACRSPAGGGPSRSKAAISPGWRRRSPGRGSSTTCRPPRRHGSLPPTHPSSRPTHRSQSPGAWAVSSLQRRAVPGPRLRGVWPRRACKGPARNRCRDTSNRPSMCAPFG